MKKWLVSVGFACYGLSLMGQTVSGDWHGMLEAPGVRLRLVFHIAQTDSAWQATMDSPDQKVFNLPVQRVQVEIPDVQLGLPNIMAQYTGRLGTDGTVIEGVFTQGTASFPMRLQRQALDKPTAAKRPQEPKPPFPYSVEEVVFSNPLAANTLAGTLTMPGYSGKFPAAILISGSGPQDRDESLLDHKPFLVLADYLTRRGFAVLRYDDRGVGKSTGDFQQATSSDFATDVAAALAYLNTRPEIDPKKIGLIGHSEGGLIAPMVAATSPDVAFVVLLAGTGVPGADIVLLQQRLIAEASGASASDIEKGQAFNKKAFDLIKKESNIERIRDRLQHGLSTLLLESPEFSSLPESQQNAQVKQSLDGLLTPWFRYFLSYDPVVALRKVKCPVLALNGSLDLQVAPSQNLPPIAAALKKARNQDVTITELAGLNHLFQHAKTGSPTEYQAIEETFSPEALQVIADWLIPRCIKN